MATETKPSELEQSARFVADRLEAWAEYHHRAAMSAPEGWETERNQNLRDNYRDLGNMLRGPLFKCERGLSGVGGRRY